MWKCLDNQKHDFKCIAWGNGWINLNEDGTCPECGEYVYVDNVPDNIAKLCFESYKAHGMIIKVSE